MKVGLRVRRYRRGEVHTYQVSTSTERPACTGDDPDPQTRICIELFPYLCDGETCVAVDAVEFRGTVNGNEQCFWCWEG